MTAVPFPLPDAPLRTVIHNALLVAVQVQPAVVITGIDIVNPVTLEVMLAVPKLYLHGTPACVTVKVSPAMVIVPLRDAAAVFAATLYPTVLLPVLDSPLVIVIQGTLLSAFHVAVDDVLVTIIVPALPFDMKLAEYALRENCGAAAACVTTSDFPAIAMAPDRVVVAVFAATR